MNSLLVSSVPSNGNAPGFTTGEGLSYWCNLLKDFPDRRQQFAMVALHGLLTTPAQLLVPGDFPESQVASAIATIAVLTADAVIAELDKPKA